MLIGESIGLTLGSVIVPLMIFFFVGVFVYTRYKRCSTNEVLVIYGKVSSDKNYKILRGGGVLVIPLVQEYSYLSLEPIQIDIDLKSALSAKNIRVNVPSVFTIAISTEENVLDNAVKRLLNLSTTEIKSQSSDIIFGQLRQVIASLTIEEINTDREKFITSVYKSVEIELNKIGLTVINVNIRDIIDESGYIEAIGKKAAAEAIQKANVDVAQQKRDGDIGVQTANREREVAVAKQQSESTIGQKEADMNRRIRSQEFESEAIRGENIAKANIAQSNAELAEREAESRRISEVSQSKASKEIEEARKEETIARLRADELASEEVEREIRIVKAEAEAEKTRKIAQGQADAIYLKYEAEAKGNKAILESKAEGYKRIVEAAGGNLNQAATLLMIEKIESVVDAQAKAISNIKFDKITVWDTGNGGKSSTSNFIQSLAGNLPPLHDVAKMAGINMPAFFGDLKVDENDVKIVENESEDGVKNGIG